jgi:hypothetical protein
MQAEIVSDQRHLQRYTTTHSKVNITGKVHVLLPDVRTLRGPLSLINTLCLIYNGMPYSELPTGEQPLVSI